MKKLMEDLFQHIIPVNEGYDYLFSDLVYVPIYETSLLVTKRTIMPIQRVFVCHTTCALTHNMEYVYCSDDYDESFL